jgi:hypothetical protein
VGGDGAGPIALNEYVRFAHQRRERFPAARLTKIDLGRQFSSAGIDDERQHRGSMCSGDEQHVGAVAGKNAAAHRAGDDMG